MKTTPMLPIRLWFVLLLLAFTSMGGLTLTRAQDLAGPFDLASASQYTANFATTCTSGGTLTATSGQLVHAGYGAAVWVYDTVPDATPTNATFSSFCVTTKFTPQYAGDSFGFLFYNNSNRASGSFLALFNVDYSGADERIRFFSNAAMTNSTPGNQLGLTRTLSGGGFTTGKSYSATLVVSPIASSGAVATMIISDSSGVLPNFIATQYLTGLAAPSGEIGFRSNRGLTTGTASFDDIAVRTPLSVSIMETSTTAATVSWPAYSGTTNYKVYRDGVLLASTTSLSYSDSGPLDRFKSYEYQVVAYNSNSQIVTASPVTVYGYRRFSFVVPWDDASTGTAADVSDWSTQSASQQVTISNGHFFAGGQRIRFMGTNMVNQACFPAYNDPILGDVAEKIAAHMAKLGINCVRLMGIDASVPFGAMQSDKVTLDPTQMDELDYFISRLKAHGIYVDLVLHSDRYYDATVSHGVDLYHPAMIQMQKDLARDLLTHTNPYTGNTYANEPAVALIEINNENGLIHYWRNGYFDAGTSLSSAYLTELQSQWNTWLQSKYANTASLSAAWAPSSGTSYGTTLISNGTFSGGFASPWNFSAQSPAVATYSVVANGSPDGLTSAFKVSVTTAAPASSWLVMAAYSPVDTASVSPIQYTASFWAKSSAARTIRIGLQQNHSPYSGLIGTDVSLTPEWRQYKVVLPVSVSDVGAQFIITNLAAQTGDIWFADFSLKSGNSLIGGSSAWAEGVLGSEMLTNGSFASGAYSPWVLQYCNPPLASLSVVQDSGVPYAARINITTTSSYLWKVGMNQTNLTCTNGQPYTVTFQAKSSVARSMGVGLTLNYGTYPSIACSTVNLTTSWQTYTVVLPVTMPAGITSDNQVAFGFSDLASTVGQVWITNVSLKQGVMSVGLPAGETLGTATILQPSTLLQRSRAAQKDWLTFLWEKETTYWGTMKSYIKTTLNAKGLVIGTQTNYSPALVQAAMDVVDVHSYWQHPSSVSDPENWVVQNLSMVGNSTGGCFSQAALTRVPGKPFVCTEYNTPSPITYGGETLLLATAYAAMHDWDGLFVFAYAHAAKPTDQDFTTFFQIAQEPVKMLTLPVGASIMRKGAVATSSNAVTASVTLDQATAMAGRTSLSASTFGLPLLSAVKYPTGLKVATTCSQVVAPYLPSSITENYSITGELMWDTNDKLVTVNTAKAKVFAGKSNNQSFNFGDGVIVTPGASMQAGNWCAISLMAKDGANFASAGKVLITATGYTDNHGMLWKTGMGPLDATSSVGTNWGKAPVLTEGIDATIVLPAAYDKVTVWTLDTRGQHLAQVPVTSASGNASFTLSRSNLTIWYEAIIAP